MNQESRKGKIKKEPSDYMKHQRGQTIIEALVAISLLVFGILGVLRLMSQSLGLTGVVRDQYIANHLAAEGVEVIKNIIDTNVQNGSPWNNGITVNGVDYEVEYSDTVNDIELSQGRFLRFDPLVGFYDYEAVSPVETRFKRTVTVRYPDCNPDCNHMQVNSVVKWRGRGNANFDTDIEDHFYNWNQ
jgi:hypothetical protein